MKSKKRVVVISGPTGVGENTIVGELVSRYQNFVRLTTATTRKPRLKERDRVDYYFFSNEDFLKEVGKGNIPEYQNSRDKNVYYGTYLPELEKRLQAGANVIVTPDLTGTRYFKEHYNATTIFILPDSMENLRKRHLERDPAADKNELEKRLEYARYEMENEAEFYDHKVVNEQGKLEAAIRQIVAILENEGYQLKKVQKPT